MTRSSDDAPTRSYVGDRLLLALRQSVAAFEEVGLEYALIGGFAAAVRGRLRFTQDLDVLGIAEKTGRIAKGLQADMVVIDGDPADSISGVRNVVRVFREGREIQKNLH